jgi:precorrin-2 dehydrogenase/sirohydrochlorin ferrochelatase
MPVYPINLNVEDRLCVVVGGGAVGARKALCLSRCGARVTVVSPAVDEALRPSIDSGAVRWCSRGYLSADLLPDPVVSPLRGGASGETAFHRGGVFLVIAATDNPAVNAQVREDAGRRGVLCSVADQPEGCDFTLPAVVSRGDLTITVSTSGKSPALARKLRRELEMLLGEEYAVGLKLMGAVRKKLLGEGRDPETHRRQFRQVIDGGLISLIKEGRFAEVDQLLLDALGEGYTFESLMKAV